jgi:50S ribosomal subunit-associated GTPase HflX
MDVDVSKENLKKFKKKTSVSPIQISCETSSGLEEFKEALRKIVSPKVKFHHTHEEKPDISQMPDTTGEEIPEGALKFATFLKLDKPKEKTHPSRGNIH